MAIRIDGEELPESAIENEYHRLKRFYAEHLNEAQLRAEEDALREKAVEQAIGARLLLREADEMEITVPEREIDHRVNEMIDQCGSADAFMELLQERGLTEDSLRHSMREGLKVDMLTEQILEEVGEPDDEEIREFYEAHREEYVTPEQVEARHILVKPVSDSDEDRATARAKLTEAENRLAAGEAFDEIAWSMSECPSGKRSGGQLGLIRRGTLVPEMESPLFALKDGERSDVIETTLGMHILQVDRYIPAGTQELEDIREKVVEFLSHARRGEFIARYVNDLKDRAVIQEDDD